MTTLMMILHGLVCIILGGIVLMQSGRGGGLTESFSSAESMFGAKTNEFMVKATTVMAAFFLITCLSLAFLSTKKDKSLMVNRNIADVVEKIDVSKVGLEEALSQEVAEIVEIAPVDIETPVEDAVIPDGK